MTTQTIRVLAGDVYRDAVTEILRPRYTVIGQAPPPAGDLCLVEQRRLPEYQDTLRTVVEDERPVFYPVVLLRQRNPTGAVDLINEDGRSVIDDIVTIPIEKPTLYRRLDNLLIRRRYSHTLVRHYERRQERFDGLFDAIAEPAVVLDDEAQIIQMNDLFCDFSGEKRNSLFGRSIGSVFDCSLGAGIFDHQRTPPDNSDEDYVTLKDKNDIERHVKLSSRRVILQGTEYVVLILTDITSMIERLEELEQHLEITKDPPWTESER